MIKFIREDGQLVKLGSKVRRLVESAYEASVNSALASQEIQELNQRLETLGHYLILEDVIAEDIEQGVDNDDISMRGTQILFPYTDGAACVFIESGNQRFAIASIFDEQHYTILQPGGREKSLVVLDGIDKYDLWKQIENHLVSNKTIESYRNPLSSQNFDELSIVLDPDERVGIATVSRDKTRLNEASFTSGDEPYDIRDHVTFRFNAANQITDLEPGIPTLMMPEDPDEGTGGEPQPSPFEPALNLISCVGKCISDPTKGARVELQAARLICMEACRVCARIRFFPICLPCAACLGILGLGAAACLIYCLTSDKTGGQGELITYA